MRFAPLLVAVIAAASLAPAQDARDIVSPTRQYIHLGYSEAVITAMIQSGHRVVDAEVSGVNPQTFDVDAATCAFGTSGGLFQWTLGGPRLGATTHYATNDAPTSPFVLGTGAFRTTNGIRSVVGL